ncbi:conjugal transfer protein TraI, partial [Mesorhizobium sp. M2D.F.Ca.ET.145.01.1.1]
MSDNEHATAPMRLRAEPPRVTRLSRKLLAGIGFVASLGIGGALIYALQTHDRDTQGEELYSTSNRQPADGLAGLPRDYTGPILGPPLPGDLGRPILEAQNKGQSVVPPMIAAPSVDEAEQRRRDEEEAARTSQVFFQAAARAGATAEPPGNIATPNLAGLEPAGQTAQDRQLAFLNVAADRRTVAPDHVMAPASP